MPSTSPLRPIEALRQGGEIAAGAFTRWVGHIQGRYRYHPRLRAGEKPADLAYTFLLECLQSPIETRARSAEGWGRLDLLFARWLDPQPHTTNKKAAAQLFVSAMVGDQSREIPTSQPTSVPPALLAASAAVPLDQPAARPQQLWRARSTTVDLLVLLSSVERETVKGLLVHDQAWLDDDELSMDAPSRFFLAPWCPLDLPREALVERVATPTALRSAPTHDADSKVIQAVRNLLCRLTSTWSP